MRAVVAPPPLAGLLVTVSTWDGPTTASPVGNDVRKVRISHYFQNKIKIEMLEIEWNYEIIKRILYEQV